MTQSRLHLYTLINRFIPESIDLPFREIFDVQSVLIGCWINSKSFFIDVCFWWKHGYISLVDAHVFDWRIHLLLHQDIGAETCEGGLKGEGFQVL